MPINEAQARKLLSDRDLEELLPLVLVAHRQGCAVWSAKLFTPYGDARAEIQIYPLREDPVTVVDMEEEITALERSPSRALVHEVRDNECGILVTCSRKDEEFFNRFFEVDVPEKRSITYHPQLDRILGGDYFHQLNGHWLKACISSIPRAMATRDLLKTAAKSYAEAPDWNKKLKDPLPQILAVLSIPPVDLPGTPPEYKEWALTQLVVSAPESVQVAPPQGRVQVMAFCRQVFGLIESAHRAGISFSRDAGCCLRPEFLIADGSLSDVYFLSSLGATADPHELMLRDLGNALLVSCEFTDGDAGFTAELLALACSQYTRQQKLPQRVFDMVRASAEGLARGDSDPMVALVKTCFRIQDIR